MSDDDATVFLTLDLSLSHLPRYAEPNELTGVVAHRLPNGWLLAVPADPTTWNADYAADDTTYSDGDGLDEAKVRAAVLAIQLFARARGCDWVLLDADSNPVSALRRWDW